MAGIAHQTLRVNGINIHFAEAGEGPLVILCHGFPECWYSWRHQLEALADAGYRVVAPDQRGYGKTDIPEEIASYTLFHLVGDIVGLVQALGEQTAVVIGHDWGAGVAWVCAQMRPDIFRAVGGLSVPMADRTIAPPMKLCAGLFGDRFFYQLYFQTPGVAEHEFQHDIALTLRKLLMSGSGTGPSSSTFNPGEAPPATSYMLEFMPDPGDDLPAWLSREDLNYYVAEFEKTGFRGGLNWYRNLDLNWELLAPFEKQKIEQPAIFIRGERDLVPFLPEQEADLRAMVPNLTEVIQLPGVGHWTTQEDPQAVNDAILKFLESLPDSPE